MGGQHHSTLAVASDSSSHRRNSSNPINLGFQLSLTFVCTNKASFVWTLRDGFVEHFCKWMNFKGDGSAMLPLWSDCSSSRKKRERKQDIIKMFPEGGKQCGICLISPRVWLFFLPLQLNNNVILGKQRASCSCIWKLKMSWALIEKPLCTCRLPAEAPLVFKAAGNVLRTLYVSFENK